MPNLEQRLHSYEPLWGEWYLGNRLYSGSASAVYELSRQRLDKQLRSVVKVLEINGTPDELGDGLSRAMDEIERMEFLRGCPHIVAYLDDTTVVRKNEQGAIIGYDVLIRMEYLTCLSEDIRNGRIFTEPEIENLGRQICAALSSAHMRNIIHRDIKPANLFRSEDGRYLLGDFGVSGEMQDHEPLQTLAGTTAYMAPEVRLGAYDQRADFYSLGLVLYQLLNNNFLPFIDENSTFSQREAAIRKRLQGTKLPKPQRGAASLRAVIMKATALHPEDRFSTANEMRQAIGSKRWGSKTIRSISRFFVASLICLFCAFLGILGGHFLWPHDSSDISSTALGDLFTDAPEEETVSGSRYEVINQNLSWDKAKVYCESRGGHLVTITSQQEEAEIIGLLGEARLEAVWIGANNLNAANGFQWVTDERFSYAAWGSNEPNNDGKGEYYLMLMYREDEGWVWNDSNENGLNSFPADKVGFICEWDESHD